MDGCIYRTKYGECNIPNRSTEYGPMCRSDCTDKHPSNADRIRAMTDEELADELLTAFAAFYDVEWSREAVLDWLKQEAGASVSNPDSTSIYGYIERWEEEKNE